MNKKTNLIDISKIKNSIEEFSEDKERFQIQYFILFSIFATITSTMAILNIFQENYKNTIITGAFAILSILNLYFYAKVQKMRKVSELFFLSEVCILFIYLLIKGSANGFSALWLTLFPFIITSLYGKKIGTVFSLILFAILGFLFWTPIGGTFLQFEYDSVFKIRFPVLYFFFYIVAFITEFIREHTHKTLKQAKQTYQYLYRHDALTGILNRYGFNEIIDSFKDTTLESGLTLMILDTDFFKNINDEKGHVTGDKILCELAKILTEHVKGRGSVCRWGGEEFAIIMKNSENALQEADALRSFIEEKLFSDDTKLTVSIGVATCPKTKTLCIDKLFTTADINLFIAKNSGRNCVVCDNKKIMFGKKRTLDSNLDLRTDTTLWDYQNVLDSFTNTGIYVITEAEHKILFFNKRVREVAPNMQIGMICNEIWNGTCENCPLLVIGEKQYARTFNYDDPFGKEVEISATRIMWKGTIPAFVIRVWPHIHYNVERENALSVKGILSELYTIDKDFNIVSFTNNIKNHFKDIHLGKKCYKTFFDSTEPCADCPAINHNQKKYARFLETDFLVDSIPVTLQNGETGNSIYFKFLTDNDQKLTAKNNYGENQFDIVTNGYNRSGFIYNVEKLRENGTDLSQYAILFINIRGFKAINDVYGYAGGDNLLRTVFNSLITSSLQPQISARKESDHFVLLIKRENLDFDELPKILRQTWNYQNQEIQIHCLCGIYFIDDPSKEVETMMASARMTKDFFVDEYVKPYEIFNEAMRNDYVTQTDILTSFDQAIRNKEFKVFYQPVVNPVTGKAASAEALIRWISPERGMISPAVFIPTLEKTGFISKVDLFVIESVVEYLENRQKQNLQNVPISVNLSWMDFYDQSLVEKILEILSKSEIARSYIRFEITETSYTSLEKSCAEVIAKIRDAGSKILLDDFGSGYSSFGMIQNYDFDILKIDMSFTKQLESNEKVRNIVETIIEMCHKIGLKVVAEGVETESELEFLKSNNCDFIQGYFYSKPLSDKDFTKYIEEKI